MPPSTPTAPVSSPSPNPQYDFILRDPQQSKRGFGLPSLPKPMLILVGVVGLTFIIIIIAAVLGGGKGGSTQQLVEVVGRAQEIARVSTNMQQQSQDPDTQYLAATTQIALASEQYQLTTYLAKHGVKITPAELLVYKNSSTDTQLQAAKQNNDLETSYDAYLKTSLAAYQNAINNVKVGAPAARLAILNSASTSTQVLLAASEITSLPASD